jgi:hypothetical protein
MSGRKSRMLCSKIIKYASLIRMELEVSKVRKRMKQYRNE